MNPLSEIICREIAQRGVLPFARFMELALYCPKHGYYETKKDNPGRRGDYYTSVGVGEVFGQLLAFQFAEWLEPLRSAECGVQIVEAGAHDGKLAGDILAWLQLRRPELFEQIEYWILEPSEQRQGWQRETLKNFIPHVRWFDDFGSLSSSNPQLNGVVFSNELLDAMPTHRFGWDAAEKAWYEWGVAVDGGRFVWSRLPAAIPSSIPARDLSEFHLPSAPELLAVLPDGYIIEACPAAENWWRVAAGVLERGKLLTIDYGLTDTELVLPDRTRGTLRAYYRHHASGEVLANVGEQDLTAHINFSALQAAGESAGLKTDSFQTQSQFLAQILGRSLPDDAFGNWNPNQTRQFQTLTHPEHLGRAFRVLVQSR
jgi:SAM-dependent MidA family methyltransferase